MIIKFLLPRGSSRITVLEFKGKKMYVFSFMLFFRGTKGKCSMSKFERDVFPIKEKRTFILLLEYNCIPANTEVTKSQGTFLQPHVL